MKEGTYKQINWVKNSICQVFHQPRIRVSSALKIAENYELSITTQQVDCIKCHSYTKLHFFLLLLHDGAPFRHIKNSDRFVHVGYALYSEFLRHLFWSFISQSPWFCHPLPVKADERTRSRIHRSGPCLRPVRTCSSHRAQHPKFSPEERQEGAGRPNKWMYILYCFLNRRQQPG